MKLFARPGFTITITFIGLFTCANLGFVISQGEVHDGEEVIADADADNRIDGEDTPSSLIVDDLEGFPRIKPSNRGNVQVADADADADAADGSVEDGEDGGEFQGSGSINGSTGVDADGLQEEGAQVPANFTPGVETPVEDEAKNAPASKPQNRIKVACWDFRTMGQWTEVNDEEGNSKKDVGKKDNSSEIEGEALDGQVGVNGSGEPVEAASELKPSEPVIPDPDVEYTSENNTISISSNDLVTEFYGNRTVEIVNMTYLLHDVLYTNPALKLRSTPSNCSVVMFYATWCPFSAKAAPHFNALPRAYPPLRVAAVDSSKFKNINTYFGILSVPTVVLFHNGKIIAKFNDSSFTLTKFSEFIEYFTDLKGEERMNVTTKDFEGPLPSVAVKDTDWYLLIAWVFIIFCFFHYISKTNIWRRAVDFVRTTWREAEAQHEHVD